MPYYNRQIVHKLYETKSSLFFIIISKRQKVDKL